MMPAGKRAATVLVVLATLGGGCLRKKTAPAESAAPPAPPAGPGAAPSPPAAAGEPAAGQGAVTPKMQAPNEARVLSSAFSAVARALRPTVVRIDVEIRGPALAQARR